MEFPEFADFESFNRIFKTQCIALTLTKASSYIESFTNARTAYLINFLTNKWPSTLNRIGLQSGARRLVQSKFYKELYGISPNPDVLKRDMLQIEFLNLTDIKPEWLNKADEKQEKEKKKQEKIKPKEKKPMATPTPSSEFKEEPKKEKAPKTPKTPEELEFAKKVKDMPLDQLINWAKELGVVDEKISKHKDKPVGLAKMNISNLIRPKLKKN